MSDRSPSLPGRALSPAGVAYIALTLATLFWSGNFVTGRALRDAIDPLVMNTLRWVVCLALLLPLVGRAAWAQRSVVLREWRLIVGLGATGLAAFQTLVYVGLQGTTAINALLIIALVPAGILVGAVLTGTGRPSRLQWLGAVVSLAGVGVIVTDASLDVLIGLRFNEGDLWMLAAVVVWVVYSLLLRRMPADLSLDVSLAASAAVAIVLLVPAMFLLVPNPRLDFPIEVWVAILYVGLFASLLAFRFWSYGVSRIGPERAGQFVHLMPLFGSLLAVALLGETLAASQLTGAALVLAGIVLVNRKTRRQP